MDLRKILEQLRAFVQAEHEANQAKLKELWHKPLSSKLNSGEAQRIRRLTVEDKTHLTITLGEGDSRFREGDMICLHGGDVLTSTFIHQATIEAEHEGEWLLRTFNQDLNTLDSQYRDIYAEADGMDLQPFYDKALEDVARSTIGRTLILPLLGKQLNASEIYPDNYDEAADYAESLGLNNSQIDAVAKGVAARYLACIQGPPGTGKTKVISVVADRLVAEGQRVLLTSHTHMAINNALNQIAQMGVPVAKVGASACTKGLSQAVKQCTHGDDWRERPDAGYVIGATPFATCTQRLETYEFDTVIFDEASQITVALAVMAMRKARRFVFVGDHKQLPPVILAKSVLVGQSDSIFSALITDNPATLTTLDTTYRMNRELAAWPSRVHYHNRLEAAGSNADRRFTLPTAPAKHQQALSGERALVFIPSPGQNCKTSSSEEATLVVDIVKTAVEAGMTLSDIGIVSPYRKQGKLLRKALEKQFGVFTYKDVVTDTVERMQGQEREMIILSLCTTDLQFLLAVAPFFFQSERLNVAITRPKTKLVLIGPELTEDFAPYAQRHEWGEQLKQYISLVNAAYRCSACAEIDTLAREDSVHQRY